VSVALARAGIGAEKQIDPESEGRFRVTVGSDEVPRALSILSKEGLPAPATPGVLDALGQGGLIESRTAEHAKLIAGTAGDLERSLRSIDGVLGARVHLAVPQGTSLNLGESQAAPTASVLIRHRGAAAPIPVADVQRLLAGAVTGLRAESVSVVMMPGAAPSAAPEPLLARLGPLQVAPGSAATLRALVAGAVATNLLLVAMVVGLWLRMRRARTAEKTI